RVVIFGRHDLLRDAPIPRVQLLLCRNTLMYFNSDVQSGLLSRLQFSLVNHGFLVLGKVEMLLGQNDHFEAVDMKQRIFRKTSPATLRSRLLTLAGRTEAGYDDAVAHLSDVAFEHSANASVLLDAAGALLAANSEARHRFGILPESIGRPFQDLELSYRPVELRSSIDLARTQGQRVEIKDVARHFANEEPTFL